MKVYEIGKSDEFLYSYGYDISLDWLEEFGFKKRSSGEIDSDAPGPKNIGQIYSKDDPRNLVKLVYNIKKEVHYLFIILDEEVFYNGTVNDVTLKTILDKLREILKNADTRTN